MRRTLSRAMCIGLAASMLLAGCSSKDSGETTTVQSTGTDVVETEETTIAVEKRDTVASPTDYVTEDEMALADQWAASDESAIAAVMKKAEAGEPVTIAVLGGSITQGTISSGSSDSEVAEKKMYAEIFHDWWTETFPDSDVTFINAGIGATDSYLGVHRVQKDVLDHDPDLVLIEFSVNDANTTTSKINYDNLIRTIEESDCSPAVLLLFMAQSSLDSAQDMHSQVGFTYKLPMVSYKNVISDMMDAGTYSADQLSGDTVHPSALGHRIVGEILWKYLNSIYEVVDSYGEPAAFDYAAATKDMYTNNPHIDDSQTITPDDLGTFQEVSNVFSQFPNDWQCTEGDGEITFTINCRNLGIMYYCQTNGKGGQYDVYVDGEKQMTLDADFTGGWGNYADSKEVYTSDAAAEHTIVIKKADGSTGDEFTILGLLVSE